ncbi:MAG: AMP-binding protein [Candidatus Thermoplasmatota archaeon]|nr:AMP-binding protein [Candidatus Thermoplasmatota archaeon]
MNGGAGNLDFDPLERYYNMSSEEITRTQERKLREFLKIQLYPFSPYYRKLFDDNGIDPGSIRTIKDLERIPLTTKEDIMSTPEDPKRYKDFILQPDLEKIKEHWPRSKLIQLKLKDMIKGDVKESLRKDYYPTFMIATSGTTGNNVPFMFTSRDIKQFSNAFCSLQDTIDLDPDHVVLNTFPFAPHLAFILVYFVNLNSTIRMFHTGGGVVTSTEKTLEILGLVDANIILGVPSYVYHLLRKAQELGCDLSSVKIVGTAGEKLTVPTRKKMEGILKEMGATDVMIFNVYGTTEMRDAFAECDPGSDTFHIHPNIHICEIVDPETGRQKRPGERGALAVTNIDGRGSVVCRFLIGDIFEGGIQYGKCPHCGREGPRLVGPIGRIKDYSKNISLTKIKGTLLNLNSFHDLIPSVDGVDEWQVCIEKKNDDPSDLDILRINVSPIKGFDRKKLSREITKKINDAFEINPIVDTSFESDELFELMEGKIKARRIVDNRTF